MDQVYFELADASGEKVVPRLPSMRLCRELEGMLKTDILESQLQHIYNLCDIAIKDENHFFMFDDAWLKITISLKDSGRFLKKSFSIAELTEMIRNGRVISRKNGVELEPEITIRRNVLPRKGDWKNLYDLFHCEYWNRRRIHQESLGEDESSTEKLKGSRKNGEQHCELAIPLQPSDDRDAAPLNQMGEPSNFQEVQLSDHPANQKLVLHAVNSSEVFKLQRLSKGAAGIVWKVLVGNSTYAMKFFQDEEGSFTIEKEYAELGLGLHPHIILAFGHSLCALSENCYQDTNWEPGRDRPCLLMELLDGTLEHWLDKSTTKTGPPISRVEKLDLLLQIASAMRKLHENNVVHGDLKLANILYSEVKVSGDVRLLLAKVADFDGARRIASSASAVESPCLGTIGYASPEQLRLRYSTPSERRDSRRQDHRVDSKCDVYSFGVVAYEILTEHWAWGGEELKATTGKDFNYKRREVGTGKRKLIDCRAWSSVHFKYQKEVISLVESCLELDPVKRPEFSKICDALTTSKSNLQELERKVAIKQKIFVCLSVIIYMLFHFLHYASAASITVVVLVILTCLIRNWPWFKFMSTFPAQILIQTYKGVRDRLAWTKEYISAARKSNSNIAEYDLKMD